MTNRQIEDRVFFQEPWTGSTTSGCIDTIMDTKGVITYRVKCDEAVYGRMQLKVEKCFDTKEECEKAIKKEHNRRKREIKKAIKTPEDLVQFMYDNCVAKAEEYTDWTAREAVREIAKSMMHIDLEKIKGDQNGKQK